MSSYNVNNNPELVKLMIKNENEVDRKYYAEHSDSLVPLFVTELRELGFEFEVFSQVKGFLQKHEKIISPIALRYYRKAKLQHDKSYFVCLISCKGNNEIIKELLEDFQKDETSYFLREMIGNQIRRARSRKFISEYLEIISNTKYGMVRGHFFELLASLKCEEAVPVLVEMLDRNDDRPAAIFYLGKYKRESFRTYFERFRNDKSTKVSNYAKAALKKIDK